MANTYESTFEKKNAALWTVYSEVEAATKNQNGYTIAGSVVHPQDPLRLCVYATDVNGNPVATCIRPNSTVQSAMSSFKPVPALPASVTGGPI